MALYKHNTSRKASFALTSISGFTKKKTMNETHCREMMEAKGSGKGRKKGMCGRKDARGREKGF